MRRLIAPLALAALVAGAAPASAAITVAKTAADTITVTSTSATPNDALAYKLTAGKLGIDRTSGDGLQPGLGCTGTTSSVTCAVDFISRVVFLLGPGDDTIAAGPTLPIGMHPRSTAAPAATPSAARTPATTCWPATRATTSWTAASATTRSAAAPATTRCWPTSAPTSTAATAASTACPTRAPRRPCG